MKMIKKIAAVLTLSGVFASGVFALDFGGLFENNTKFVTQKFDYMGLFQTDSVDGWFKTPITKDEKIYFSIDGNFTYRFSLTDLTKGATRGLSEFLLNIPLCKLTMYNNLWGGIIHLNAGRFQINDSTGIILDQESDGVQFTYSSNYVKAIAYAGYTGLTNGRYTTILDGSNTTFKADNKLIYQFNSPYVIAGASCALPYLFSNQTVGLEFFSMIGVGGISGDNSGYNRFYVTAMMNGPIVDGLFYSVSTTVGIDEGVSNLSKVNLSYYPPKAPVSLEFNALYASGENGFLKPFKAFTSQTAYLAFDEPGYSGILKTGLAASVKPVEELFLGAYFDAVFSCANGFDYTGVQWKALLQYQMFTDLKAGLSAYQFYGKDSNKNSTSFTINLVFAF